MRDAVIFNDISVNYSYDMRHALILGKICAKHKKLLPKINIREILNIMFFSTLPINYCKPKKLGKLV